MIAAIAKTKSPSCLEIFTSDIIIISSKSNSVSYFRNTELLHPPAEK